MSNNGEVFWCDARNDRAAPSISSESSIFQEWTVVRSNSLTELHGAHGRKSAPRLIVVELDFPDAEFLEPLKDLRKLFFNTPIVLAGINTANWLRGWAKGARVWNVVTTTTELIDTLAWFTDVRRIDMNVLHAANSRYVSPRVKARGRRVERNPGLADAAVRYVQQHYSENIRLEDAARMCGMSARQFAYAFRKEHGIGFREFVVRYRIECAKQILGDTRLAVKEVAYRVGFKDTANFCKVFRVYVGCTAAVFRDALLTGGRVSLEVRPALIDTNAEYNKGRES